jgi:hypothetical protein
MDYGQLTIALLCNPPDNVLAAPGGEERYYRGLDQAWIHRVAVAWTAVVRQVAGGVTPSRSSPPLTALRGNRR